MKKRLVALLVISSLFFSLHSEEVGNSNDSVSTVAFLIEDGLFRNEVQIRKESINLQSLQKLMLYEDYKKSAGVPFACNLLLGYGIGSFVQKDWFGGFIGLGGDLLGITVMISGIAMKEEERYYSNGFYYTREVITTKGYETASTGMMIIMGTRIFELIRPFVYTNSYNKSLRRALSTYAVSYKIEPSYNDGIARIDASLKINLN